jgi:hypothetical protein
MALAVFSQDGHDSHWVMGRPYIVGRGMASLNGPAPTSSRFSDCQHIRAAYNIGYAEYQDGTYGWRRMDG